MTAPIEDLITPVTRAQVEEKIYQTLATLGVHTTSWKPGAVARAIITATSIVLSAFSTLQANIARSGFLEYAEGAWLAVLAKLVYGVDKRYATFASGQVTLTNAGGGSWPMGAYDLAVRNPETGAEYRNTTSFNLLGGATLIVPISAVEAGAASSSPPDTITEMVTPLLQVTVRNDEAVIGLDDETDPELRARCYERMGALSPMGPWDAYAYAAKNAKRADGSAVAVNRTRLIKDGYGNVTVYCATPSGPTSGTIGDLSTDLGAADEAIQRWAAPLAVTAITASAVGLAVAVDAEVWVYNWTKLDRDQIEDAIEARVLAFFQSQPIGGQVINGETGKLFRDALSTAIGSALPEIFHVVLNAPAADVDVAPNQIAQLGAIALAITLVAPSGGAEA